MENNQDLDAYKDAMRGFAAYLGGSADDPRDLLYRLDAFIDKTEARFRPVVDAHLCLRAWMPGPSEKVAIEIVDELWAGQQKEITEEDRQQAKARVRARLEEIKNRSPTAYVEPPPSIMSRMRDLARLTNHLHTGEIEGLLPKVMDAAALLVREAVKVEAHRDVLLREKRGKLATKIPDVPTDGSEWWVVQGYEQPAFQWMRICKVDVANDMLWFQTGDDIGTIHCTNRYQLSQWRQSGWAGLVLPYDPQKCPELPPNVFERVGIVVCGYGNFFKPDGASK